MKNRFYLSLLLSSAVLCGCTGSEEIPTTTESPPAQRVWTASVEATHDSIGTETEDEVTRSLYYGGNNGTRYALIWDKGDDVQIYKGDTYVGTLSPSYTGQVTTTLTGTLTGDIAAGDNLILYFPSRDLDFAGQDGTIAGLSSRYLHQTSTTTVSEAKAAGGTLSMDVAKLTYFETIVRFILTDVETGDRIHLSRFQFYAASGQLVKTKPFGGATTYFTDDDPFTVTTSPANGEYPGEIYVAIMNDHGKSDTYRFLVWVGEDIYSGPTTAMPSISSNGALGFLTRSVRKTIPVSSLLMDNVPDQAFTGFPISLSGKVAVKDGETVLTEGADYDFLYADNLNVGEATVTVKGRADVGATCTTPYLGTQLRAFNIVKATPVIALASEDMTLVYDRPGQNSQTRVATRVFIDNNGNGTWDEGTDYDITSMVTVTYTSSAPTVAAVDAETGQVTAIANDGSTTITAAIEAADNWTAQTASYTAKVITEVGAGHSVTPWGDGGTTNDKTNMGY